MEKELDKLENQLSELIVDRKMNIYYIIADFILNSDNKDEIQKCYFLSETELKLLEDYIDIVNKIDDKEKQIRLENAEKSKLLIEAIDKKLEEINAKIQDERSEFNKQIEESKKIGEKLAKSNVEFEKQVNEFEKLVNEYIEKE